MPAPKISRDAWPDSLFEVVNHAPRVADVLQIADVVLFIYVALLLYDAIPIIATIQSAVRKWA